MHEACADATIATDKNSAGLVRRQFMKYFSVRLFILVAAFLSSIATPTIIAQKKQLPDPNRIPPLVRTTTRHEVRRLGYGGTLTLIGAPAGSIKIEAWPRNEVDITAEIQIRADTEADLDRLAALNNFVLDEDLNHIRVMTVGTHDKAFMRPVAKKFPRELLGLPWKIDFRIRVPVNIDLDINAGTGPISLVGTEGDVRVTAASGETDLNLRGGSLAVTIGTGKVNLTVPVRSWRRGGVDIRVAAGEITLDLPSGFSADIDGEIIQAGEIVYSYDGLEAREKPGLTPRKMKGRIGVGGAFFQMTMGAGKINIKKAAISSQ